MYLCIGHVFLIAPNLSFLLSSFTNPSFLVILATPLVVNCTQNRLEVPPFFGPLSNSTSSGCFMACYPKLKMSEKVI